MTSGGASVIDVPSTPDWSERDEDLQRRRRVAETERLADQQRQERSGDPRRDYKREPERRTQGRDERRQARERLYGDFREARYAAITATKTARTQRSSPDISNQ
jgi:hypothetical protein